MGYILFLWVISSKGDVSISFQRFNDYVSCESAFEKISGNIPRDLSRGHSCVPEGLR